MHGQESIFAESILTENELPAKNNKYDSKIKLEPNDGFDFDEDEDISENIKSTNSDKRNESIAHNTPKRESRKHTKDSKESKETVENLLPKKSTSTAPLSYQLV